MSIFNSTKFWDKIQYCDPRLLYLFFALAILIFVFVTPPMPVPVPDPVQRLYNKIESLSPDKLVIVDSELASGIRAECEGQYVAVIRHLFQRNLRFAVMTWTTEAEGQKFGRDLVMELAKEYNKEYGKDFCIWNPVFPNGGAMMQDFAKDIIKYIKTDIFGTELTQLPVMKGITDISSISLVYKVSYVWDRGSTPWIGFIQSVYGTPYACGTVAISSSGAYPFLDSGQLCGMLAGASGAAAYESLVKSPGIGTKTVLLQSFATLYIVVTIILGNLAMIAVKIIKRRTA